MDINSYIKSENILIYPCASRSDTYNEESKLISEKNLLVAYNNVINNNNYTLFGGLVKEVQDNITTFFINKGIYFIRGYTININKSLSLNLISSGNNYIYLKLIGFNNNCLTALDTSLDDELYTYNGCAITILFNKETDKVQLQDMLYLGCINNNEIIENNFKQERLSISNQFELNLNTEENLSHIFSHINQGDLPIAYIPFNDWLNDDLIFDDGEF